MEGLTFVEFLGLIGVFVITMVSIFNKRKSHKHETQPAPIPAPDVIVEAATSDGLGWVLIPLVFIVLIGWLLLPPMPEDDFNNELANKTMIECLSATSEPRDCASVFFEVLTE